MEATLSTNMNHTVDTSVSEKNWLQKFDEAAEFNRYAIMSIGFLIVGCLGGITAGFFGFDAIWKLAVVVAFSMFSVTMMLGLAPMKLVTRSILLAVVVDLLIIAISVL
ncbi:MAG: hypothetical protein Salg2KO_18000 [Salibacteraceae bacterium]